jgi:pimeloyl-ACP methyl ester carboxylesterase/class 3 adenylate cyclase
LPPEPTKAETTSVIPDTRYARCGDVNIAYQVLGDGPIDLIWSWGLGSNVEMMWEEPSYAAFLRRLASFSRLIVFDRRGAGLSDRTPQTATPTLEERVEDVLTVLDAAASKQAAVLGISEGGTVGAMLAAAHPERVSALILYGTMIRFCSDADHPYGVHPDRDAAEAMINMFVTGWGVEEARGLAAQMWAPSLAGDLGFERWIMRNTRQVLSRGEVQPFIRSLFDYDVAHVLPAIRVPTLVIHRTDDTLIPVASSRFIAEQIPAARYLELPGADHFPFAGDSGSILDEIEEFLTGSRGAAEPDRRLVTLLFSDIVGSTQRAAELGDRRWRDVLTAHDAAVRADIARYGGREVKRTGDGFLAAFDGPARAIQGALAIAASVEKLGLEVRTGLHTGECEILGEDLGGIAVHVGARISEYAAPREILVSGTVRDLVAGSGIRFGEPRVVDLRGLPGRREIFPVLREGASPRAVRSLASRQENLFRKEGDYWTLAYGGKVVSVKDSKGMHDIATLLAIPGREVHVLDLATPLAVAPGTAGDLRQDGLRLSPMQGEELIDATARSVYRQRISALEGEIDEAEAAGDEGRTSTLREELEFVTTELGAAYGLSGRPRRATDDVERARKAVTNRIRDALSRIEREHIALGGHLRRSIKTGTFCSYEPETPISWHGS